jgi:hypothetical protein
VRIQLREVAIQLGLPPLQVLIELAAMGQPPGECYPEVDEGFVETIRQTRRVRMGLPAAPPRPHPTHRAAAPAPGPLPVSPEAAAILDKLWRKGYGLKPVKVFTLVQKWVHEANEDHVRELVERGYLEWTDPDRDVVNLVAGRLADTERVVEQYRART